MKLIKQMTMVCFLLMIGMGAKAEVIGGDCGPNVQWSYDADTRTLTISGSGEMYTYYSSNDVPWLQVRDYISSVVINDGVSTISDYAFCMCGYLESVSAPTSIYYIGSSAFAECYSLQSFSVPSSCTVIGEKAFFNCRSMRNLYLSDNIQIICDKAFANCFSLSSATIPSSVTSILNGIFEGCYMVSLINNSSQTSNNNWGATFIDTEMPDGLLIKNNVAVMCRPWATSVTMPDNVTSIAPKAFQDCYSLENIYISNFVTSIGDYAFSYCTHLTSVTIPDRVTTIGKGAFQYCICLTSLDIPRYVTSIGEDAFFQCVNLTSVSVAWEEPLQVTKEMFTHLDDTPCTLYVPIGTSKAYASAAIWRNFKQIEEYDPDYIAYYLKVKLNSKEVATLEVGNNQTYKWRIPEDAASVYFNGTDVTGQVSNGIFTTPAITQDSELVIQSNVLCEDVNGDGQVNSLDVLKVYKYMQAH